MRGGEEKEAQGNARACLSSECVLEDRGDPSMIPLIYSPKLAKTRRGSRVHHGHQTSGGRSGNAKT